MGNEEKIWRNRQKAQNRKENRKEMFCICLRMSDPGAWQSLSFGSGLSQRHLALAEADSGSQRQSLDAENCTRNSNDPNQRCKLDTVVAAARPNSKLEGQDHKHWPNSPISGHLKHSGHAELLRSCMLSTLRNVESTSAMLLESPFSKGPIAWLCSVCFCRW